MWCQVLFSFRNGKIIEPSKPLELKTNNNECIIDIVRLFDCCRPHGYIPSNHNEECEGKSKCPASVGIATKSLLERIAIA